ncbi:tripartite tricarboxylate transporter TctB family protein [Schnuerera ultunensis]|uniref:tripartite tricarboxylate transporter TctB family protein n=1 Tax=Schnuerera ultunensis TaxID=45497 RepID=UPI00040B7F3E|nr:tripartite tricarboxylate transporter TctB family protein [Schnuerera ultunensis]
MRNHIKLFIAGILAIAFSLVFFFNSFQLPKEAVKLPRILVGLIILLSIGIMIEGYLRERRDTKTTKAADENNEEDEENKLGPINYKRAIIFTIMIATYIFLLEPVGYFIVTPVYIISTYLFLKATKVKNMIIISVAFTAFVYFVFVVFLKLPIPMGILQ